MKQPNTITNMEMLDKEILRLEMKIKETAGKLDGHLRYGKSNFWQILLSSLPWKADPFNIKQQVFDGVKRSVLKWFAKFRN